MDADGLVRAMRAALDETERLARAAQRGDGHWEYRDMRERDPDVYPWQVHAPDARLAAGTGFAPQEAQHIAHNDPAAVLRRVAADREIVAMHEPTADGVCSTCLESESDIYGRTYERAPCYHLHLLARGLGIKPEKETP